MSFKVFSAFKDPNATGEPVKPMGATEIPKPPVPKQEYPKGRGGGGSGFTPSKSTTTTPTMTKGKTKSVAEMQRQISVFNTMLNNTMHSASNEFLMMLMTKHMTSGVNTATKANLDMSNFGTAIQGFLKKHQEKFDGVWDQTTDDALRATWVLGNAIVSIADKLGIKLNLTKADMDSFRRFIPDMYSDTASFSPGNLVWRAKRIAPFIYKMRQAVGSFATSVIDESHKYGAHLGGKAFDLIDKSKVSPLTNEEQKLVQPDAYIPGVEAKPGLGITYSNIASLDSFTKFLQQNDVHINDEPAWEGENLQTMLNYVRQQIGERMKETKNPTQQPQYQTQTYGF